MADHTPYQRKIIDRYYKNLDAIQFQRLSELATDLYLAEGKKRDRLWVRVEQSLRKLEFPRIADRSCSAETRSGPAGRDSQGTGKRRLVTPAARTLHIRLPRWHVVFRHRSDTFSGY